MYLKRIKSADDADFESAYKLYVSAFPISERRRRRHLIMALEDELYHFNIIYDGDLFIGILLTWETDSYIYIDHFAIRGELRGQNYGSRTLELLKEKNKPIILEIEPPVDKITINRCHFYQRLGFIVNEEYDHFLPPFRLNEEGCDLVIMTYPEKFSKSEYDDFYAFLLNHIMSYADNPDN